MDQHSDIDYMIVFSDGGYRPQTYLDKLKRFVSNYYPRSEIYQSSPTIVLELNHIKFELVPSISTWFHNYNIPDGSGGWMWTEPNTFNDTLSRNNNYHKSLIKPTIRLVKLWNAWNGYLFNSYSLEKFIAGLSFSGCINQRDYMFYVFRYLDSTRSPVVGAKEVLSNTKYIIKKTMDYENSLMTQQAEEEIRKIFYL